MGFGGDGRASARLLDFVPARFAPAISQAAQRWSVSSALLAAQIYVESRFNPFARSGAGALGIAQFMPATAAAYGLGNPFDAERSIDAQELSIAPVPEGVDLAVAGAAPLAGITAITAVDALDLSEGDVLLVAGATGGVGSLAVQLAAKAGATVVAPALPDDEEYLRVLGVSEIVPRDGEVAAAVRECFPDGVDALLDLVSYTPDTYDTALKDGARIASPTGAAGEGPGRTMVMATPSRENLERLGALLADSTLGVPVQATYQLTQGPEALTALTGEHTQGKLAIQLR